MSYLRALFSEDGTVSLMRVMSLIALLIGSYLALTGHDTNVAIFVTSAFGGKAAQKYFESKV